MRRLRATRDVRAVLAGRHAAHGPSMVLHARLREDRAPARVAVVAGRKVGTAVRRNRAKRRLRAALTEVALPPGVDFVVSARPAALTTEFPALRAQLDAQITRASTRAGAELP